MPAAGAAERRQHKPRAQPWAKGAALILLHPVPLRASDWRAWPAGAGQVASSLHTHGCQAPARSSGASTPACEPRSQALLGAGECAQGFPVGRRVSLTLTLVHTHELTLLHSPAHTQTRTHCAHTHPATHADSPFHTLTFSTRADSQLCTHTNSLTQVCTCANAHTGITGRAWGKLALREEPAWPGGGMVQWERSWGAGVRLCVIR